MNNEKSIMGIVYYFTELDADFSQFSFWINKNIAAECAVESE